MRFIFGFIFFGLLFYGMYLYFPEAFHTLVSWAAKTFNYIQEAFQKFSNTPSTPPVHK